MQTKKILAVLAHPDDESFGMGGTLALYAQQGAEVHLICATRGEAGEVDEKFLEGYDSIAERRESELRCAASHLGLKNVHFLSYRDSGMTGSLDNQHPEALINAPLEKVTGEVVEYIRTLQPDLVLTFDPVGGYHHPDHIHIQKAAVEAFLRETIGFPGMSEVVSETMTRLGRHSVESLEHVLDVDREARAVSAELIRFHEGKVSKKTS